eukprot:525188-Hanusia_phi.AAC.1
MARPGPAAPGHRRGCQVTRAAGGPGSDHCSSLGRLASEPGVSWVSLPPALCRAEPVTARVTSLVPGQHGK